MCDGNECAPLKELAQTQADFCRVFSNARRVQILWELANKELSVGAIAEAVGSSLQNVSQHLSIMKSFNVVSSRREGQTIYYQIDEEALAGRCLSLLRNMRSQAGNQALYPQTNLDSKGVET